VRKANQTIAGAHMVERIVELVEAKALALKARRGTEAAEQVAAE